MLNAAPDLASYDVILVNSSAGKDSQAMLDLMVELATAAGVRDRLVVVHADLGRVEWAGTRELAERQAARYGVRFEVVSRPQGDLLTQIEQRGMFPSSTARYCTSDHKRGQVRRVMTKLTAEVQARRPGPVRILNCMGLRADESPARAKKVVFEHDAKASNGKRHVDAWLPIHEWTTAQVWDRIRASGVEHHRAYDLGMKRLSCVFCVFAPKSALLVAGKHNPELLDAYVKVEEKIGHDFRKGFKLRVIQDELAAGAAPTASEDSGCWNM
jgi:3'-phosphoadenosine 5'-phosphosulfate sulfotransferase (PAPS reductase)/FAD synthetase